MSAEFYKTRDLIKSLSEWQSLDITVRKSLITELFEMTWENASSEKEFAAACNFAAALLADIIKYPELIELINEKNENSEKN